MGTNSALIATHIIENSFQVMAIMMMSLAQAVDILKIQDKMSPATRAVYDEVRAIFPAFSTVDSPLYKDIERVENYLKTKKIDF
jgi:histidine ammonia-lyase